MIYSSLLFIYAFFPISLAVYFFTPKKFKDISLFFFSVLFCGFFSLKFMLFMLIYTTVNYISASITYKLKWKESKYRHFKSIPFSIGILFDVTSVFIFRTDLFSWTYDLFNLPDGFFPIGISFYTLSAMGYLIDVYKGRIRAEVNFIRFGLFIMMFPRLIMCSVVSYDKFVSIWKKRRIRMSELGTGFEIFIRGLAKKVIIADNLFMMCSAIKSLDVRQISSMTAWLGITSYILCLYFTISGISDMGNGIACCFGFRFPQSFNYPLFSSRIRHFCAKWHIQITQWFRKYIVSQFQSVINEKYMNGFMHISVMALLGFWYGFNLCGALWGFLMGFAVVAESRLKDVKMLKSTGIIYTFLATTVLSVFLSCGTVSESLDYLWAMIGGNKVFADSLTLYLVKSYILVLLIAVYFSTDLFVNTISRIRKTRFRIIVSVFSPVVEIVIFAVCTALISYNGNSNIILLKL